MANLKGITKNELNNLVRTLPLPFQRHMSRCKELAKFFVANISMLDWYKDLGVNDNVIIDAITYHDIGKTRLDINNTKSVNNKIVYNKKSYYKKHVDEGLNIIRDLLPDGLDNYPPNSFERVLATAISEHHERFDGNGFPRGLKGGEIHFIGQITSIIDYLDNRVFYGKVSNFKINEGIDDLKRNVGKMFDKKFMDLFLIDEEELHVVLNKLASEEVDASFDMSQGVEMVYQPIVNMNTNQVYAYESLMRIHDNRFGTLMPDFFIPLAEKSDQIIKLGQISLEQVCRTVSKLKKKNVKFGLIWVNFSAKSFEQEGFIDDILKCLEFYELKPNDIGVEITERVLSNDFEGLTKIIQDLHEIGIKVALDDFGEEYSSLAMLDKLLVDEIKISGTYITKLLESEKTHSIVNGIVDIAKKLKIEIVCEHVETQEVKEKLMSMGVRLAQGYYYSKPMKQKDVFKYKPAPVAKTTKTTKKADK